MADRTLPFYAGTKSAEISCIYTFRYFEKNEILEQTRNDDFHQKISKSKRAEFR